jgi:hypothetical protein
MVVPDWFSVNCKSRSLTVAFSLVPEMLKERHFQATFCRHKNDTVKMEPAVDRHVTQSRLFRL